MKNKSNFLIHSCCGPCLSAVADKLISQEADFAVLWYNPNIEPAEEHDKRRKNFLKLVELMNLDCLFFDYDYKKENELWHQFIQGLENEPEGGERCAKCFEFRLSKAAKFLKGNQTLMTTLTVSPYKKSDLINSIGKEISNQYLETDFKENNGYRRSIELSKKYGLYRQNYCGCQYSKG